MKHGAVRCSSLVALVQTCSIYTCKLEFAEEDDPKLEHMLKRLTAEYDPTDRRSSKRKERDGDNGANTLIASIYSLTDMNLCCSSPSRSGTYGLGARSHGSRGDCLNSLIRVPALGEPLFAQLGTVNEYHLRLNRTLLVDETAIKGEYLFAEAVTKDEHLFAEIVTKDEHLFAETASKGEHLFAEIVTKGEHLFAETASKGEHLFAETASKGEHLFAEAVSKGEHLFAGNII